VARSVAGENSVLGLLGLHTRNSAATDEGVALYYEQQALGLRGLELNVTAMQLSMFTLGLACGVITPPQTFFAIYTFLYLHTLLNYLVQYSHIERDQVHKLAQNHALTVCLRKFRGVPDLDQAGVCYLQDTIHYHGLLKVEQAVQRDPTVLDRLAVGVCALEDLPDLQKLGVISVPQPLRKLAFASDLDDYILSFES